MDGLADRHPEILWQALPPTYQRDITELTHAVAGKMDPQLWNGAFGLLNKAVRVLRDKKQYFLESSFMAAAGDERARVESNWDAAVAAMDALFTSDVSNLEKLKTMDWERFLSTTCVEIMDRVSEISSDQGSDQAVDFVTTLRKTTVETVSRDGEEAVVRISAPGEDPEEIPLTRVEGRWVPTDMAEEWSDKVAEARERIAAISEEEMAEGTMQAMMMFGMVEGVLDQLAAVNSQEEFEQAIQGMLAPFLGMAGQLAEEGEGEGEDELEP
jgi:hypothetical protein